MKLNRFYFAALAATTIASCSNEQDIVTPGSPELKQGEALVTFDVRGHVMSRATPEEEKAIKTLAYKVYNKESGDSVEITRMSTASPSMIKFKISAEQVTAMKDKQMEILAAVNSSDLLDYGTLTEAEKARENKNLDRELANAATGLPASARATFQLDAGTHTIPATNKAQRVVSRIYVKKSSTSTGNIDGITINVRDVATEALLFGNSFISGVTVEDAVPYTVQGETAQVVAYVYPTESGASVDITLNGIEKNFPLPQLAKNKNYSITITTNMTSGEADGSWDVTIDDWDPNEGNVDADLDQNTPAGVAVPLKSDFKVGGNISVENGKLAVQAYGESQIDPAALFDGTVQVSEIIGVTTKGKTRVSTRANALDKTSDDGVVAARIADGKISLTVENTTVGEADKEYTITLEGTVNGKAETIALPIVSKGYPENFSVNINGIEIMTVGSQTANDATDPSAIINIVNAVNAMPGATFAEKAKAYVMQDTTVYEKKYMGTPMTSPPSANRCPAGFEAPTVLQIKQIFGVNLGVNDNANNRVLVPEDGEPVTQGFNTQGTSGNSMQHLSKPHYHYIFRYVAEDGETKELYIPRGNNNGYSTPANNFLARNTTGTAYPWARLIVWKNEVQLRPAGAGTGVSNWLRCVRKAAAAN